MAVLVGCDGENAVHDPLSGATDAEQYATVLDRDGLLRVTLNLSSIERPLGRLAHKAAQQLALHRARQNAAFHAGRKFFDKASRAQRPHSPAVSGLAQPVSRGSVC